MTVDSSSTFWSPIRLTRGEYAMRVVWLILFAALAGCGSHESVAPGAAAPGATHAVLRTPDSRFANLAGYSFQPNYVEVSDPRGGTLRMHYVDAGPRDAPTVLLLHGNPTWSYLYREVIPLLNAAGYRTIALDYIGMGRSDKLPELADYTYDRHLAWLREAFEQLDRNLQLGPVTIFGHDYGTPLGIRLMAEHFPDRFDAFVVGNASLPVGTSISPTHLNWRKFVRDNPDVPVGQVISSRVDPPLSDAEVAAWNAPYPDVSYKAAIRAFPEMVPDAPDRPEAVANTLAWRYLERFNRPFMTIFGAFDEDTGRPSARLEFVSRVPGAYGEPQPQLDTVAHYAPEDRPEQVAAALIAFLGDVHHPQRFKSVKQSTFERDLEDFSITGLDSGHEPNQGAVRVAGRGSLTTSPMDLTLHETVKAAFRYQTHNFIAGDRLVLELWSGTDWTPVLTLHAGRDFRSGAQDYGFTRFSRRSAASLGAEARLRLRAETQAADAKLVLFDIGVYGRPPSNQR